MASLVPAVACADEEIKPLELYCGHVKGPFSRTSGEILERNINLFGLTCVYESQSPMCSSGVSFTSSLYRSHFWDVFFIQCPGPR